MIASRRYFWIAACLLLLAAGLRLYGLAEIPPGLTHDEADHGLDAWGVVQGDRPLYFTVGFGREPLFDYATALLMAGAGPTYLAGRLTAVFFSMLLVAATYAWTRRAFDRPVALLAMAGMALAFWPVMTGRHALRTVTLPALFVLSMTFFWSLRHAGQQKQLPWRLLLLAGVSLGLTFYTYIPSRALWLVPLCWLLYLAVTGRPGWRRLAPRLLTSLLLAGGMAIPLWRYLAQNPTVEQRITQLSAPLIAARAGDWGPLLSNMAGALRLFTIEGDTAWRYNIAGRPLLTPVMGLLFYAGLLLALWLALTPWLRRRRPAAWAPGAAVSLVWLSLGLAPALITGPELSTTQAIGMQPIIYVLPALALVSGGRWLKKRRPHWRVALRMLPQLLFLGVGLLTVRDYFGHWAQHPEVRVQYETSLRAVVEHLNESDVVTAGISTITPGRFHTPAVVQLTLNRDNVQPRYFDGRHALLLPTGESRLYFSRFAPLAEPLVPFLEPIQAQGEIPQPKTDLDRPLTFVILNGSDSRAQWRQRLQWLATPRTLGDSAQLLAYQAPATIRAGQPLTLLLLWALAGPQPVDLVQFTHLTAGDGVPVVQVDRLDAPSRFWYAGDWLLQQHVLILPATLPAGTYDLRVGLYQADNGERLPVVDGAGGVSDADGVSNTDNVILTTVTVTEP